MPERDRHGATNRLIPSTINSRACFDALCQASPVSTVLYGFPADGDLDFAVKKIIGSSPFQCPHASYSASSFGQKSIVAQWRDIDCPAGQVMLTRAGG